MARVFRFAIDRGGTFTDVYAERDVLRADGSVERVEPRVIKLLSEDPANYPDAPRFVTFERRRGDSWLCADALVCAAERGFGACWSS